MRWYTTLLYGLLWCIARLPMRLFHALGAALGWLFWVTNDRKRRVIEANLALVRPDLDGRARRRLARDCVRECGIALVEAFGIWTNAQRTLARVREVRGEALFDAALDARKGPILCAPHLGSWEVANYWIVVRRWKRCCGACAKAAPASSFRSTMPACAGCTATSAGAAWYRSCPTTCRVRAA